MQRIPNYYPHTYTVFEYNENCDNKSSKIHSEEEYVRLQLDDIISRSNSIESLYASCVAQYAGGHINGILDEIRSLGAKKRDLEMQRSILSDRLLEIKRKSDPVSVNVHSVSSSFPVIPHVEEWSMEVYNHTKNRTLNKQKFVSPLSLLGGGTRSYGQYNYTYYNDQPSDEVQIIDHSITEVSTPVTKPQPTFPIPCPAPKLTNSCMVGATVHINDIISRTEDSRHVIIIRGLPGSGKSSFCQAFKDIELRNGHSAPRILSIDHFFMDEGKYEYDAAMEPAYQDELYKLFKRQIDEGFFSVILVDSINQKTEQFIQFYHYARIHSFQPSVLELKVSPTICAKRTEHKFNPMEIYKMADNWEETPNEFTKLDATSFLQDSSIEDVEMEDIVADDTVANDSESGSEDDEITSSGFFKSKWDEDFQETKERLDGTKQLGHEHNVFNINDFLKLEEEDVYKLKKDGAGKCKQVKWADFEELKQQKRRKELGFVAGYTDWNKIMSDDIEVAEAALVQVRYYVKDGM